MTTDNRDPQPVAVATDPQPVATIAPVMRNRRFRTREYNCDGSTSYTFSDDHAKLSARIDRDVESGRINGGGIDEHVEGIGWTVRD
jgi:hypothetical protein